MCSFFLSDARKRCNRLQVFLVRWISESIGSVSDVSDKGEQKSCWEVVVLPASAPPRAPSRCKRRKVTALRRFCAES